MEECEIDEPVTELAQANVVRFTTYQNNQESHQLIVRFVYGRLKANGTFQGAYLDDGIIFSGPTYIEHDFHNGIPDEHVLVKKVATFQQWDGTMKGDGK